MLGPRFESQRLEFVGCPTGFEGTHSGSERPVRTLVFHKGAEFYRFRYREGDEAKIIEVLIEMAADPGLNLDWDDAEVLTARL